MITTSMPYSRLQPSPRYRALLDMYRDMHVHGDRASGTAPEKTFPGKSLAKQAMRIKRLIDETGAASILDYGSGKGLQYDPRPVKVKGVGSFDGIIDYWGVDSVKCYDPAYTPHSALPQGLFDGVVCTDVMEHCPEEDVPWIVEEIFSFAERFVFVNAACFPAQKRLPNGENAHCTIQPPQWWEERFRAAALKRPGVKWELWVAYLAPGGGIIADETRISG
jgi:hypothetical protein